MKSLKEKTLYILTALTFIVSVLYFLFLTKQIDGGVQRVYDDLSLTLEFVDQHTLAKDKEFLDSTYNERSDLSISVFDQEGIIYWNNTSEKVIKYPIRINQGRFLERIGRNIYLLTIREKDGLLFQFVVPLKKRYPFNSSYLVQPFDKDGSFVFSLTSEKTEIPIEDGYLNVIQSGGAKIDSWYILPFSLFLLGVLFCLTEIVKRRFGSNWFVVTLIAGLGISRLLSLELKGVNFLFDSSYYLFGFIENYFELAALLSTLFILFTQISLSLRARKSASLFTAIAPILVLLTVSIVSSFTNASDEVFDVSSSLFISSPKIYFWLLIGLFFGVWYSFLTLFKRARFKYLILTLPLFGFLLIGNQRVAFWVASGMLILGVLFMRQQRHRIIFSALIMASVVAISILFSGVSKMKFEREKFGNTLVSQQNIEKEFELNRIVNGIKNDPIIREGIVNNRLKKQRIKKRIRHEYLRSVVTEFAVEVDIVSVREIGSYDAAIYEFRKGINNGEETDFDNVFRYDVPSKPLSINYFGVVEFDGFGLVYLFFKGKQSELLDVVGRLKEDKSNERYRISSDFDFEIWDNGKKVFSRGNPQLASPIRFENSNSCRVVYVAFNKSLPTILVMNFLFYLLLLMVPTVIVDLSIRLFRFLFYQERFLRDRIWLVITSSVVFPLTIFATIIILTINREYQEDLLDENLTKIENLKRVLPEISSFPTLKDAMLLDFNLYDDNGEMVFTSQKSLYQGRLLSSLLPFHLLVEQDEVDVVEEKRSIGGFDYTSLFDKVTIGGNEYWLEVPFFNSFEELNSQRIIVLEVFLYILFGWMIFHYFVSNNLIQKITESLQNVAESISKVDLSSGGKKISYSKNDEVKVIIDAYNEMLEELDESKKALTKSEKENAWREMAKQVAHEIKNPLTPMKLMLQHLQRKLSLIPEMESTSNSVGGLIDQVDTLSEIASSFSTFAQMPNPEVQKMEMVEILNKQLEIFKSDHSVDVVSDFEQSEVWVKFDPKLLGRIFLNLLLNAKQSIPSGGEVEIKVSLKIEDDFVKLQVCDNGEGVPEDLKDKIFLPNFTTKSTGSGIGLAVAKKGVEFVNGQIWFENNIPAGTKFIIKLPLVS